MAKKTHQRIFTIHSWLGLLNGFWLLILGLTGSLYVYTKELDEWINKETLAATPRERRLPYDSLYKIVRAKYPTAMGTTITRFPKGATESAAFRIYVEDGTKPRSEWSQMNFLDIDPYSGKILREGNHHNIGDSFLFWSASFHWSLNYGEVGVLIVTLAGILLFINILTGIVVYRKYFWKAMIFRAPVQWKNWRTGTSGLHRYIGVWSLVLNILIFYSGLQMTWGVFDKRSWEPPTPAPYNMAPYASIDKMIDDVQKTFPGFDMKYFYIPFTKQKIKDVDLSSAMAMGYIPGTPSIVPLSHSNVSFNVNTGEVIGKSNANEELAKLNLWDQFNSIAYSFHAGTFAGEFSRVLYVVVGLTPSFLAISGFMLWWRRKRNRFKGQVVPTENVNNNNSARTG